MRNISTKVILRALGILSLLGAFTVSAACTLAPSGLVRWWKAEGSTESSIGGAIGVPQGSVAYRPGLVGQAFEFDGSSGIEIPDAPDLNFTAFSAETWIFPTRVGDDVVIIMNKEINGFDTIAFEMGIRGQAPTGAGRIPTGNLAVYLGGVNGMPSDYSGWSDSHAAVPLNSWTHVALTYGNGTAQVFVNGILTRNFIGLSGTLRTTTGPLRIGTRSASAVPSLNIRFRGLMDEPSLYNRALTAAEVSAIYVAGIAGKCQPAEIISLSVANPSFELLSGTDFRHFDVNGKLLTYHYSEFPGYPIESTGFYSTNAIPGWSGHASSGTINLLGTQYITNGLTGANCAWINVTGEITQTLSETFQAGQLYRLSVDVGYPLGVDFPGYIIGLYANGQVVVAETNSISVVSGDLRTATVEVTLPANSPFVGTPIEIRLGLPAFRPHQTLFDNVRLTAQPIAIVSLAVLNPSFEQLTGTDPAHFDANGHLRPNHYSEFPGYPVEAVGFTSANAIPGWSGHASSGTINYLGTQYFASGLTGTNSAWINVTGQITQTLSDTFQAGQLYRLSVDVGHPFGTGFPGYVIGLYAYGQVVASQVNSIAILPGDLRTATVEVALPANSPFIGAPIEIRLGIPGSKLHQTVFDNVRLTALSLGGTYIPTAPTIVIAPGDKTVTTGQDATFSVIATGTGPLSYQWQFKGANIADATNSILFVPATRKSAAGTYSVRVCNAIGCAPVVAANLTVTPAAALVSVGNTTVQSLGTAIVPVRLVGNGVENALSFSLRFDPRRLIFQEAILGTDASTGQFLVNASQVDQGVLGVILALSAGNSFHEDTNDVLRLNFRTALVDFDTLLPLSFADSPIIRKVSDAASKPLEANWLGGTVAVAATDYEADVTPVPNGDKRVDITDWVQVGRYVAGLDELAPGPLYQRVDSAPRVTAGNGQISVTDWVQAGRFAAGLDPSSPAGGPLGPVPSPAGNSDGKRAALHAPGSRIISLGGGEIFAGQLREIPVNLAAEGDENALAFSVHFDPALLVFAGAGEGADAKGAVVNINTQQTTAGRVGLALALTSGVSFARGNVEIAKLRFIPLSNSKGSSNLSFIDAPIVREVANGLAEPLPSIWTGSDLSVVPPIIAVNYVMTPDGAAVEVSWQSAFIGAKLESAFNLAGNAWELVPTAPVVINGRNAVTIKAVNNTGYYRLLLP